MDDDEDQTLPLVLVIDFGEQQLARVEALLAALPADIPDCEQVVVVSGYRARAVLITAGIDPDGHNLT